AELDVLRQDEHADRRMAFPDLDGRAQTLIAVRRRQPEVDDDGSQRIAPDFEQKVVRVSALGDDVDPCLAEEPGEALAKKDAVLCDRYAHGISALTRVPPPIGVQIRRRPPSASTRSASRRRPLPPSLSAPPIPLSTTSTTTWPFL